MAARGRLHTSVADALKSAAGRSGRGLTSRGVV
jgi:hypothetical protein